MTRLAIVLVLSAGLTLACTQKDTDKAPPPGAMMPQGSASPTADNTRVNARDRENGGAPTPMDQGNDDKDLTITQSIRKAVMADGALSITAKNCKVITRGGRVVLRGPVMSDQERADIEAKARAVADVTDVDDQLEVKTP